MSKIAIENMFFGRLSSFPTHPPPKKSEDNEGEDDGAAPPPSSASSVCDWHYAQVYTWGRTADRAGRTRARRVRAPRHKRAQLHV